VGGGRASRVLYINIQSCASFNTSGNQQVLEYDGRVLLDSGADLDIGVGVSPPPHTHLPKGWRPPDGNLYI